MFSKKTLRRQEGFLRALAEKFRGVAVHIHLADICIEPCPVKNPVKYVAGRCMERGKRGKMESTVADEIPDDRFINIFRIGDIRKAGFDAYFVDHTVGVYPQAAAGVPWDALTINVTGDVIADLTEDMAAEQKARAVYDNILRLSDDPDVNNVIRFLRQREVVHYQRFGEALNTVQEKLDQSNVYYMNPAFPMNR